MKQSDVSTAEAAQKTTEQQKSEQSVPRWYVLGMGSVILLSLFLNFFLLGQNGYGNLYYAAGIKSMLMNWHNFFFVSSDPGGFVTIDKPPLSFWLQVGSARLFGLSPWSVMLPQALAGVCSVPLLAHLVRRTFGPVAGLLAAITLALTPISVVTNRNVTMDSLLVFVLLLAAWAMSLAAETGRLRFLLVCAALVGIGFNIKMLEAYLVLPAFVLLYWFSAPYAPKKRLRYLALATVVLLVVSFCWITAVDLVPAAQRPFVGSSSNNSELQLALLYNGASRYLGNSRDLSLLPSKQLLELQKRLPAFALANATVGNPGLLRLVTTPMGEQIGWLLSLAVLGLIGVKWDKPTFWPLNRQQQGLALWGVWFLAGFTFFSGASFMHQYYTTLMAPALAALLAIGIVTTWQDTHHTRRRWFLPMAILVTVGVQIILLSAYIATWGWWLIPLLLVAAVAGVVLLRRTQEVPSFRGKTLGIWVGASPRVRPGAVARTRPYPNSPAWTKSQTQRAQRRLFITSALCILFIAPTLWTAISVFTDSNSAFPYAGPPATESQLETLVVQSEQEMLPDATLMHYLVEHQGYARYIAATPDSSMASPMILATGKPVMELGGYIGEDQILNQAQLQRLIATDTVHYFVTTQTMQEAQSHLNPQVIAYQKNYQALVSEIGTDATAVLIGWVRSHCQAVPESAWHTPGAGTTLLDVYHCV